MGGGRSAPSRPTVPKRTSASPQGQQQTRPAATYAAPPATQAPPPAQAPASGGGSGLFGQMASTAAYVPHPIRAITPSSGSDMRSWDGGM